MPKLAPSLLAADWLNLQQSLALVKNADMLHLDVMDGSFVPNITMGSDFVKACKRGSDLPCDVHLMIENPQRHLAAFIASGSDMITLHIESINHLYKAIQEIKAANVKVGIALNPATPLNTLTAVIDQLDLLLIMTVNPGFGGQKFIEPMKKKIKQARQLLDQYNHNALLAVDGGVNLQNAHELIVLGADVLVAGSAIFSTDAQQNVEHFKKIMNQAGN